MRTLESTLEKVELQGARIVVKSGWCWRALDRLVRIASLGRNKTFLTDYFTTIGPWIGVPAQWELIAPAHRVAVLEHELVHVRQCKRFGLGSAILGLPLFGLLYLLAPLPIGLAWFRWRFEREAYVVGIRVKLETHPHERAHLINNATFQLTGGAYAWTWPFPASVRRYFEANV